MEYPVRTNNIKVTSYYGKRQYYYQGKLVKDFHNGIDLIGGSEITAFEDGVVTAVSNSGVQYGKACYVRLKHSNGWQTLYYHLKSGSVCVSVGQHVKKGQKLGIMGATGQATEVHLHFQIDKGGSSSSVNPYDYLFNGKVLVPSSKPATDNTNGYTGKFKVGDKVVINGSLFVSSKALNASSKVNNKVTTITRVAANTAHPYNTTGDLGWMNESDIKLYQEPAPAPKPTPAPSNELKVGDKVKIIGTGNGSADGDKRTAGGRGWTRTILKVYPGKPYPYQVGNSSGTTGFYKASALQKI